MEKNRASYVRKIICRTNIAFIWALLAAAAKNIILQQRTLFPGEDATFLGRKAQQVDEWSAGGAHMLCPSLWGTSSRYSDHSTRFITRNAANTRQPVLLFPTIILILKTFLLRQHFLTPLHWSGETCTLELLVVAFVVTPRRSDKDKWQEWHGGAFFCWSGSTVPPANAPRVRYPFPQFPSTNISEGAQVHHRTAFIVGIVTCERLCSVRPGPWIRAAYLVISLENEETCACRVDSVDRLCSWMRFRDVSRMVNV